MLCGILTVTNSQGQLWNLALVHLVSVKMFRIFNLPTCQSAVGTTCISTVLIVTRTQGEQMGLVCGVGVSPRVIPRALGTTASITEQQHAGTKAGLSRVWGPNLSRVGLSLPAFRCSAVPTGLGPSRLCIAGTQAPLHSEVDLARGAAGLSAACGGTWKDSWGRGS